MTAGDVPQAEALVRESRPDLVLLDWVLPGVPGLTFARRLRGDQRTKDISIVLVSARAEEQDKVTALESGADDYVTKPFGRQELLARVHVLLRRAPQADGAATEIYDDGYLRIDDANADVRVLDRPVVLTPLELRLLRTLVRNRDQVLSREQLLDAVWGEGASATQVKLYVGYVRRKLEPASGDVPVPIETVRGFGYRYRTPAGRE
jgi:two-component system phosphate regulon response regulator PhoB